MTDLNRYDTALLGSMFAFPPFNHDFGDQLPDGQYQVSSAWQSGLMNGAQAGSMLGLVINGIMCDMIGYKKTYGFALVLMTGAIFLPFFADGSIPILMAGQVISGIPWGKSFRSPLVPANVVRHVPNPVSSLCF